MSTYDNILRARADMTDWTLHFTRAGSTWKSARERLLNIVLEGVLRPGWSERWRGHKEVRTVYGTRPVVCFTEQPLWAFLKYVSARPQYVSPYGILINKHDLYSDGGRPVIYGLQSAVELTVGDPGYVPEVRVLAGSCLPVDEQYRYVAFNPNNEPNLIDWSHEREWRWPQGVREPDEPDHGEIGTFRLAGSGWSSSDGKSRGRVHVLVETEADISWIRAVVEAAAPRMEAGVGSPKNRWRRKSRRCRGHFTGES